MKEQSMGRIPTQDPHRTGDDTGSIGGGYLYRRLFITRRKWKPDSVQTDLSVIDGASGGVWLFLLPIGRKRRKKSRPAANFCTLYRHGRKSMWMRNF